MLKENLERFTRYEYFIRETNCSYQSNFKPPSWFEDADSSTLQDASNVKMKGVSCHSDGLLLWWFPDGRKLVTRDYLTPFKEDELHFFYDYLQHL